MLVSFIAFTTFPALEPEEDQPSSLVNFLSKCNLESMPHRKPETTHTRTNLSTHIHWMEDEMGKKGSRSVIYHIAK